MRFSSAPPVLAALLVGALAVAGCSGPRELERPTTLPETFPNHTTEQIQRLLQVPAADTLTGLFARASLALNAPAQSGTFSSQLTHRRGDSLFMTLSPGFGIEAARALITPDSFFIFDRINKRLIYGGSDLVTAFFPLDTDDLFRNLTGLVVPSGDGPWLRSADGQYYYLTRPDSTVRYTIDPSIWRVVKYQQRSLDGTLIEDRSFLEFDTIEGVVLPRRVVLRRPQDQTTASLYYRDVDLNPASMTFRLGAGDDIRRVPATDLVQDGP